VLGADVIKVEHPDEPDQSRANGTDKALTQASNKRAITLDLKTPGDRDILKKLVAFFRCAFASHAAPKLAPSTLALTRLALKGMEADSNKRATRTADHLPPRAAGMPRSSKPAAMARNDSYAPSCSSAMIAARSGRGAAQPPGSRAPGG
jgi:hypothetical protein